MPFYLNPKRARKKSNLLSTILFSLQKILKKPFLMLGFNNIDYYYLHGEHGMTKLSLGENVSVADAYFNIGSGNIIVGDNTIFGHKVMVLAGHHQFYNGKRAKLQKGAPNECAFTGEDIIIGEGCIIATGTIITQKVTIGDNVIIASGSVVVSDIPSDVIAGGNPCRVVSRHKMTTE